MKVLFFLVINFFSFLVCGCVFVQSVGVPSGSCLRVQLPTSAGPIVQPTPAARPAATAPAASTASPAAPAAPVVPSSFKVGLNGVYLFVFHRLERATISFHFRFYPPHQVLPGDLQHGGSIYEIVRRQCGLREGMVYSLPSIPNKTFAYSAAGDFLVMQDSLEDGMRGGRVYQYLRQLCPNPYDGQVLLCAPLNT